MPSTTARTLNDFFEALQSAYGPQHWWPGETPTEVVVGAILTQNTNWANVEKAIARLRAAGCLDWERLREIDVARLAELIRPAGYFNIKAGRLKNFVEWLWREHEGDLASLERLSVPDLREALLSVRGIGRETADSIILYALNKPTFVVDAYTARVLRRHRLIDGEADYEQIKSLFEDALPQDPGLFNEYHALLVAVGKKHCRPSARCAGCPLEKFEHDADDSSAAG
jgi:endonuclease-3 related protein